MTRAILPGDPIAISSLELDQSVLTEKLRVEQKAIDEILPFEAEKNFVRADHNDVYRQIWGESDSSKHPVELPATGA